MLRIGVIGFGYWGPNIVRNFISNENTKVVAVCDKNPDALKKLAANHPDIKIVQDSREITDAPDIDAVAIVTPVSTHFELARRALENGKHIFVEKPFTESVAHAEELINISRQRNLVIMVDHTFLFNSAVRKLKQLIDESVLGRIYYYDSTRVNLGLFQHDVNVVWDLAPHDFSVMQYLIAEKPHTVSAFGRSHVNGKEDVAYITVYFSSNLMAHFSVNWLSPIKVRTTLIGGEKQMLVWNDIIADDKIKIYNKGVDVKNRENLYDMLVSYRSGDMWSPRLDGREALGLECEHFLDCIEHGTTPINGGAEGLGVVKLLEACTTSMNNEGKMVAV